MILSKFYVHPCSYVLSSSLFHVTAFMRFPTKILIAFFPSPLELGIHVQSIINSRISLPSLLDKYARFPC